LADVSRRLKEIKRKRDAQDSKESDAMATFADLSGSLEPKGTEAKDADDGNAIADSPDSGGGPPEFEDGVL
jgi:hypothetical protein